MCVIYEKGKIRIKKTFVRQRGIDKAGNAVIINSVVKKTAYCANRRLQERGSMPTEGVILSGV